jgi:ornithine cyclodeaminase
VVVCGHGKWVVDDLSCRRHQEVGRGVLEGHKGRAARAGEPQGWWSRGAGAIIGHVAVIFDDDDIRADLSAVQAVDWMKEAIDAHHRGELLTPPRAHARLGDGRLVFTAGRLRGSWFGYRSYDTFPTDPGAQLVAVHDETSGQVGALAIGNELGPRRVGAIGAVAADALAPTEAGVVAVIGTGTQARSQLWALAAVRQLRELRVYSRTAARREAFAAELPPTLATTCRPAPDARTAVEGAEIVILATSSPIPVIKAAWLDPGTYVTTLGPKQRGRAEFGLDLPAAADLLVTDSAAQIDAYDPPNVLVDTPHHERLVSLGAVRAGNIPATGVHGITVFFSVGLAGAEAFLLHRLAIQRHDQTPI